MSDSLVAGPADHVAISVADFEGMTEWYKTTFGLREDVRDRLDIPEAGIKGSLLMGPNGFRLEILSREGSERHSGGHKDPVAAVLDRGYLHWGFLVADLDTALDRLEAAGAKVTHPKDELRSHNVRFAIFEDPGGQHDRDHRAGGRQSGRCRSLVAPALSPGRQRGHCRIGRRRLTRRAPRRLTAKSPS